MVLQRIVALHQGANPGVRSLRHVVIMGRAPTFLLRGIPFAFRIHIKASMQDRIDRLTRGEGSDEENARWLIGKVDKEMGGGCHLIYGSTWDDPKHFDRVFDTSTQKAEEIVATVKDEVLKGACGHREGAAGPSAQGSCRKGGGKDCHRTDVPDFRA